MSGAALLLLSDGRFPAGGYAHSGGLEESIRCGRVRDMVDLEAFLRGRAATSGVVSAAFAAASCHAFASEAAFDALDVELDARIPSPT
ncbi:MAG: urease accessory protein UreF, partial [Mycobacterium sp.]